jgi:hypothetical protein
MSGLQSQPRRLRAPALGSGNAMLELCCFSRFWATAPPPFLQDEWNDVVLVGGHIQFRADGPWALQGPPLIDRTLTIIGSCSAINSAGGARPLPLRAHLPAASLAALGCLWERCKQAAA